MSTRVIIGLSLELSSNLSRTSVGPLSSLCWTFVGSLSDHY